MFEELATTSDRVAATSKRNDKVGAIADVLRSAAPAEVPATVAFLTGATRHGRIGVGWATLSAARVDPAATPSLTVDEVDDAIATLASMEGAGVVAARRDLLRSVMGRATEREQRLLVAVLGGELRQGALDGVMVTAIAKAAEVPVASVRRANMMTGDLFETARLAMEHGVDGLDRASMTPLRPVLPMLASPAVDVADALSGVGPASVEWKLDGARLQAHRSGDDIALYTRNLNEVTDRLPGVVESVRSMPGGDLVLDGEVMSLLPDGSPGRFQDTVGDFSAEQPAGRGAGLRAFFFDVMHADGSPLHDEPLAVRRDALRSIVPPESQLPSLVTEDPVAAEAFLADAIRAGHEGVVVKGLDQPYEAGRRGAAWRKVKPVYTLDLVVLAVEWGHGRRSGWLSNIHLGARASAGSIRNGGTRDGGTRDGGSWNGEFVMVGKTFKGMTDELLRWQTERFLGLEIGREGHVVHVRPEQVVEIAVDGVQISTRYPGGVALRFARVRRYRDDKSARDADAIDAVRALL